MYRYIIHARPHLTAKAFRYLRTLTLRPPFTGGSYSTKPFKAVIFVNQPAPGRNHTQYLDLSSYAKCFVLIKQSYNTILCLLFFNYSIKEWPTFSLSYGVNLPSSLMIVSSNAFVYSTSLLVLDFRYSFSTYIFQ